MKYVHLGKPLFGKTIDIGIFDMGENVATLILEETYDYAKKLEKIFNFYDDKSELSILNKKKELIVSEELLHVLKKSLKYCELTKGEYDISIGRKILARKNKEEKNVSCSYLDIRLNGNKVVLLNKDVLIDLGSVAKGYIADKVVDFMKDRGVLRGFVNARGDLINFGKIKQEVFIQHPRDKTKMLGSFILKNSAVATSGDYNQNYGSFEKSHILNSKDLISITVISKKLMDADLFASVIFLLDKKEREKFLKKNKKIGVIAVDKGLNIKKYNKLPEIKWEKKI